MIDKFRLRIKKIRSTKLVNKHDYKISKLNQSKLPIIVLYCISYNEEIILPYFLRHYQQFVDKIIIYDNFSTDNTRRIIKKYGAKLRDFDSKNIIDQHIYLNLKNNCYKEQRNKADFVIVCDVDEFLYHENIRDILINAKKSDTTIFRTNGYDMVGTQLINNKAQLCDLIKYGIPNSMYSKNIIFNPNIDINFGIGCHSSNPIGNVQYHHNKLKLLHYRYLSPDYVINRNKQYGPRVGTADQKMGWACQYAQNEQQIRNHFTWLYENTRLIIGGFDHGVWSRELQHRNIIDQQLIATIISTFKTTKTVLDIGCGSGHFIKALSEVGKYCVGIEPLDMRPFPNGPEFIKADICTDKISLKKFDIIMCLEVAEHVDIKCHKRFFNFIRAHARKWLIFSAAIPGQGGIGHVSERPENEWHSEISSRGFKINIKITNKLSTAATVSWYRKNIRVYELS